MVDIPSFLLPEGWRRWRGFSSTVVSSEIGIVVTGVDNHELVLLGAIMDTDGATKQITISSTSGSVRLDVDNEQRWIAPSTEGYYVPAGESMTVKIGVASAGSGGSAGSYVVAWGFVRPVVTNSVGNEKYTSVASIS